MACTVVFLHGFTHTGSSWDPVVAALPQRYRALAPDIRGHGAASAREPVSLDAVIGDVGALVSGPFTLVGYSMGGRLALHVALALPARVRRLVLIGASPGIADRSEREARRAADERLAMEIETAPEIEEFARRWAESPVLTGMAPDAAARAHADRLRNTPAGLAAALRGLGTGALPSLWGRLHEPTIPVVLAAGEADQKFRAIAVEMAGAIADARVVIMAGAGHAAHLEAPEHLAEIVATA